LRRLIGPFSQILTMSKLPLKGAISDDKLEIIEDGGIVVSGDKIVEIGKFSVLSKKEEMIKEIDFSCVLVPGFIDCHTHICHYGSRSEEYAKRNSGMSYQEILSEGGGIHNTMLSTEKSSDEELERETISRLDRHFKEGVLTCEIKTGYGSSLRQELRLLNIINKINDVSPSDIVSTCLAAHVTPKKFNSSSEYLDMIIEELIPQIEKKKLTSRIDIFIEEKAFSPTESFGYLSQLKDRFDITVHANQFSSGGVKVGVDCGARSVDHLEVINENEIKYLSKSETSAVVLPGCSLGLGIPFAPARKLLDNNCKLSIATDWNPGSAPMGDLLQQSSLLGSIEKLSNAEVFSAITFRSADALGLDDRGAIEKDKIADFVGFKTNDYREILYNQGKLKPSFICKRGKIYN
jgi:imidazolonepropionase